jgi:hypothetical protein
MISRPSLPSSLNLRHLRTPFFFAPSALSAPPREAHFPRGACSNRFISPTTSAYALSFARLR